MLSTEIKHIYKPSLWRLLFVFVCAPVLAILLGWGTRLLFDYFRNDIGDLRRQADFILTMIVVWSVLNFVTLMINKNHFVVTINPKFLSGPSSTSVVSQSKMFPLEKVDTARLLQRTFWERFWHEKFIWSTDREKIIISRFCYSQEQEEEIIRALLSISKEHTNRGESLDQL